MKHLKQLVKIIFEKDIFILWIILVLTLLIGRIFVTSIFKLTNMLNVLRIISIVGLIGIGEAIVLLSGGFDASIGSIMSLSLVIGGSFLNYGSVFALILTYFSGIALGLINGFIVGKGKVNSLIATLGTMTIYACLANIVTGGKAIYLYGFSYLWLGRGYILGIPVPVILFVLISIICFIFLNFTSIGRYIYFTGANSMAAWCSGIKSDNIKILAYSLSGFLASISGPMYASQTQRITPVLGAGFELTAFAIAFLGGIYLWGGKGSIFGVVLGAIIYGFLLNILALSGVGTYIEQVLKGILLISIVIIFQKIHRRTKL
jgi:ribose/xylose/arabinose/galactoside ABC-type transport system permease subunit